MVVFVPLIYFLYLGYSKEEKYVGPEIVKKHKKSATREWVDAAVFAIVAATLIRTFILRRTLFQRAQWKKHCWLTIFFL